MNEEELKAKADELDAKEQALNGKEGELTNKEEELKERESAIAKREEDASTIAKTLKSEYEKKLEQQKSEYETRLKDRDEVIKQLANGDNEPPQDSPFAEINKRRRANKMA